MDAMYVTFQAYKLSAEDDDDDDSEDSNDGSGEDFDEDVDINKYIPHSILHYLSRK